MNEKEDGGTAFPKFTQYDGGSGSCKGGMTLRDWFAGQALASGYGNDESTSATFENCANRCYRMADAMLKARSQ